MGWSRAGLIAALAILAGGHPPAGFAEEAPAPTTEQLLTTTNGLLADQLTALNTIQATLTAQNEAQESWHTQQVFLLSAIALGLGILWGCYTWRLMVLAKNQSRFW